MTGINWANAPQEWFSTFTPSEDGQVLDEERRTPSNFAMIPKMAQRELDPYELALYTNFCQTVGEKNSDGLVYKSNATLAKETKMSVGKVKQARRSLAEKGYVKIRYPIAPGETTIHAPAHVTIVDIWNTNRRYCEALEGGHQKTTPGHVVTTPGHVVTPKNNHIRKTTEERKEVRVAKARAANPWYDAVKEVWNYTDALNGEIQKMLQGISKRKGFKEYSLKVAITPSDLIDWRDWYRETKLSGDKSINMLEERIKVQSSINGWVEAGKPKARRSSQKPALIPITDETPAADNHLYDVRYYDPADGSYIGTGRAAYETYKLRGGV